MPNDLAQLSIQQASEQLRAKKISSAELIDTCLHEIENKNPTLNAYLEVFDDAKAQALEADRRRAQGEDHPLLGIPLALKDNILIQGRHASAASKMLEPYTAVYDATVTTKLKNAGAVFLGRTNMDEFALGGSTEKSAFAVTKNPHDPSRVPGGTSGGSAAAVAAGMALGALGSDTGGSIRQPASFCGVVGLKPTYGAVSRSGLIAAVSSFDQIGPLTRTVSDAELLFKTIRGKDHFDSTSTDGVTPLRKEEPLVVGIPRHLFAGAVDEDVRACFEGALTTLRDKGLRIVDIELPTAPFAIAMYYIINFAEVSTNLARFDGVRYGLSLRGNSLLEDYAKTRGEGFGPEVRRRIMLGTYVLSAGYYDAYYGKATAARRVLAHEFDAAYQHVDLIATPTAPTPAYKLGEKSDPLSMYVADIFTVPANLTGNPALSVPGGSVLREGAQLPVGVQFMAPQFAEEHLFTVGRLLMGENAR